MIISPRPIDLEYDPVAGEIRREILKMEEAQKNSNYGYWLDNCGDGKWYCDHCLQRHECGKRITKE